MNNETLNNLLHKIINWVLKLEHKRSKEFGFSWDASDKKNIQHLSKEIENTNLIDGGSKRDLIKLVTSTMRSGLNYDDILMYKRFRERLPLNKFGLIKDNSNFVVRGSEKVIALKKGCYCLEVYGVSFKNLRLRVESSNKSSFEKYIDLVLMPERVTKRFIYVENNVNIVFKSDFKIKVIFVSLTRNFFVSRVLIKLNRSTDLAEVESISTTENKLKEIYKSYVENMRYSKKINTETMFSHSSQRNIINKLLKN